MKTRKVTPKPVDISTEIKKLDSKKNLPSGKPVGNELEEKPEELDPKLEWGTETVPEPGIYEGLRIISEKSLIKKEAQAKKLSEFPVKLESTITKMVRTPKNCKNGDIDSCPNSTICGYCIGADPGLSTAYRMTINSSFDAKQSPQSK